MLHGQKVLYQSVCPHVEDKTIKFLCTNYNKKAKLMHCYSSNIVLVVAHAGHT